MIIDELNANGARALPAPPVSTHQEKPPPYLDTNGDHHVTAMDVLVVVNYLNDPSFSLEVKNIAVTSDPGVQQMPSVAVNPSDSQHVVIAYMDYSLVDTGYAGIGVATSRDGGESWQSTGIPLPDCCHQGAANPIARFDDQGRVFVSFMAATYLGPQPPITNPNFFNTERGASDRAFGYQANNGVFVARSDDGGLRWHAPVAVVSHTFTPSGVEIPFDITPDFAVDTFPGLPNGLPNANYGNLYVTWTRLYPIGGMPGKADKTEGGSELMIAVSRDEGQSWQTQLKEKEFWNDANGDGVRQVQEVTTAIIGVFDFFFREFTGTTLGQGYLDQARVTVGPEGDVYVSAFAGGAFSVQHSTNAGVSFGIPDFFDAEGNPDDRRLPFGLDLEIQPNGDGLPHNRFRTYTMRAIAADPARPGQVYAVEPVLIKDLLGKPIDGADIFFARSTDHGINWRRSFQVGPNGAAILNDDNDGQIARGLEKDEVIAGQALARLAVDAQGNIGVIWYDTRRDRDDHLLDVFGTVSTDGGLTFSPNFRITNISFDADAGSFVDATGKENFYLGDFIGLTLADDTGYAVWTDARNGNQDIYFGRYPLDPLPVPLNDRFEPNDSPTASATQLGRIVQSHVPKLAIGPNDEDWFLLEPAATGELRVSAFPSASGDRLQLELWSKEATSRLATGADVFDVDGSVLGKRLVVPSDSGQQVLVRVLPTPGSESTRYALDLQSLTADLGARVHGVLNGSIGTGDVALYLLAAGAPGSLQIKLTSDDNVQGNLNLKLLDPDELAVLASGEPTIGSGMGKTEHASLTVRKSQRVLFQVSSEPGSQGDFKLEFTNLDQLTTPEAATLFFPAGAGPSQAASADFNNDSHLDLVVSNALSNTISVLLGNGDGTFKAPRQYGIGAFVPRPSDIRLPAFRRDIEIADLNRDGNPDVLVTNEASSDISILLGRGDGTFELQRRFDATPGPFSLDVGDLNNDTHLDVVAVNAGLGSPTVAVSLGRGDGTLTPQQTFSVFPLAANPVPDVRLARLNADDNLDLIISGDTTPGVEVYLGNGDGTFTFKGRFDAEREAPDTDVADVNDDGHLDIVVAGTSESGEVSVLLGRGDGTFEAARNFFAGQAPVAVEVMDFGSTVKQADGAIILGPPDGRVDLVVATSILKLGVVNHGDPEVVLLPGEFDEQGQFVRFGAPIRLIAGESPIDLDAADVNGDGSTDIAVVERDGILIIFDQPPMVAPNNTPQTARDLGTVVHVVQPPLTIVPGHEDAYYRLTVPTEAMAGSGDEILDFSGLFEFEEGAGLRVEVLDAHGNVLGSGERFQVLAKQGEELLVHVYGVAGPDGKRGAGAYTLVIDVLPQVVGIQAESLLPGLAGQPGGPTTHLVLTLQGDRLDRAAAENPDHFRVIHFGADRLLGTADDRIVAVADVAYNPGANIEVSSGRSYPTAVRQTITLIFAQPLPAGSYRAELSPNIQTEAFNEDESALLSPSTLLTGHPIAQVREGQIQAGSRTTAIDLVLSSGALGNLNTFGPGTAFLTQLHNDLGAFLDGELTKRGDDLGLTADLIDQVMGRLSPSLGALGSRSTGLFALLLDPVDIELEDVDGDDIVVYDIAEDDVTVFDDFCFVEVGGNVEVIICAIPDVAQSFRLNVGNVTSRSRGAVFILTDDEDFADELTDEMRGGQTSFTFSVPGEP